MPVTKPAEIVAKYAAAARREARHGPRILFPARGLCRHAGAGTVRQRGQLFCHAFSRICSFHRPRKTAETRHITERNGFGSDPYCKEELIAELGSAFLCGHAEIVERTIDNSAAYLEGWLKQLQNDRTLIVSCGGAGAEGGGLHSGPDVCGKRGRP